MPTSTYSSVGMYQANDFLNWAWNSLAQNGRFLGIRWPFEQDQSRTSTALHPSSTSTSCDSQAHSRHTSFSHCDLALFNLVTVDFNFFFISILPSFHKEKIRMALRELIGNSIFRNKRSAAKFYELCRLLLFIKLEKFVSDCCSFF